ncbi:putative photosynthetic complex assembly protein PuhE [Aestuariicoccus sp. MJ-SS9]|uniref:putative photosynthetic complex assembly protein PuhE n=1 Tax=Aestuariicoccus sp. MJ-SS9 TaxID=3079855 RepID=UPI00291009A8|nr:putative photosynthetic complex assembly protein PuhE [Aestuariicoccus sp. MJ-SS9]MDU8910965.1 putative photosynthetic complex assembly protein PuhE [Aestuariicoccus sp. MJ-SS9]
MTDPWIAALVALFLWWFSTGAILMVVKYADRRGPRSGRIATLAALPMLAAGLYAIWASAGVGSVGAVYHAFLGALAVWGWIELAFLTGVVTGPNAHVCPDRAPEWERFIRAWGTIAYHEMALVAVLIGLWLSSEGAANTYGFWTFAVLFFARISAKLNLFLGVPKINTEFLPKALAHLPSHFRLAPMNWLFPISITALSFAVACWLERIFSATAPADVVGFSLLAAMTALALLEHWFMVLPLPDEKLWRWMLPAPKTQSQERRPEDAHGL